MYDCKHILLFTFIVRVLIVNVHRLSFYIFYILHIIQQINNYNPIFCKHLIYMCEDADNSYLV